MILDPDIGSGYTDPGIQGEFLTSNIRIHNPTLEYFGDEPTM